MPNFIVWLILTRGSKFFKNTVDHLKEYYKLYLWFVPVLIFAVLYFYFDVLTWDPIYDPVMRGRSNLSGFMGGTWFVGYPSIDICRQMLTDAYDEFERETA